MTRGLNFSPVTYQAWAWGTNGKEGEKWSDSLQAGSSSESPVIWAHDESPGSLIHRMGTA